MDDHKSGEPHDEGHGGHDHFHASCTVEGCTFMAHADSEEDAKMQVDAHTKQAHG
ncbi:MAG TPA: hypothetical protein ENI23_06105 [bacterium]|nr:hypothetical protein [bacterium]